MATLLAVAFYERTTFNSGGEYHITDEMFKDKNVITKQDVYEYANGKIVSYSPVFDNNQIFKKY